MKRLFSLFFLSLILVPFVAAQPNAIIVEYKVNADQTVDFTYRKMEPGRYTLSVTFTELTNGYANNYVGVVSTASGNLFRLKPLNKDQGIGFRFSTNYIRGMLNPKFDPEFPYLAPFKKQVTFSVEELSDFGTVYFGNTPSKDFKAFMFKSKTDSSAVACRKGVVIEVEDGRDIDTDKYFSSKQNYIMVEHLDGTLVRYGGFKKGTILVKKGQFVLPQEELGYLDTKNEFYRLNVSFFYLEDPKFNVKSKENLLNRVNRFGYINPKFSVQQGVQHLVPGTTYLADYSEDILFKEYSKKERKRTIK